MEYMAHVYCIILVDILKLKAIYYHTEILNYYAVNYVHCKKNSEYS